MESTQTLSEHTGWLIWYILLNTGIFLYMIREYKREKINAPTFKYNPIILYGFLILFNTIPLVGHTYCILTNNYI
jgi:hypothetical protein